MISLLRRNRDIRLVFAAQVVSYLGDWFTFVALAGLVQDLTDSRFLVSLVLVAFSLPAFLFSPLAGAVADRRDRRGVLVWVSGGQAVCALGLLLAGEGTVWAAFLFQSGISALAAFVRPATEAALPNLAGNDDDLRTANSLFGSTWGVMLAVGAALGGLFSSTFGREAAFIADAVTFLVAAALFAAVRTPMQTHDARAERPRMRPLADMSEAVAAARANPVILALIASKTTFAVGAGIVSQLAVLASEAFGSGDTGRGLLLGARGVGSGLGPLLAARVVGTDVSRLLRVCGLAGLGFSLAYLGAGLSPELWLACIFVGVAHLGGGAQWTLSTLGLQRESPDRLRGRVLAGDFALVTLMLSVTSVLAGVVSEIIGVRGAVLLFSALAACASLAYLAATSRLREAERS